MGSLTLPELARIVEPIEAAAAVSIHRAASSELASMVGIRVTRLGKASAIVASAADTIQLNRVMNLGVEEPASETLLKKFQDVYHGTGVSFAVQLSPAAQPPELPRWLEEHGFQRRDDWVKMYRGTEPPADVPTELRIEQIGIEHALAFGEIACDVYHMPEVMQPWLASLVGLPDWRHYMAFDGDAPAAIGTMYIKGNIAWLGIDGTLRAYRRRGAQGAIMARRVRDAIAMSCQWIVIETGAETPQNPNSSFHNMLLNGFKVAYVRPNYVYGPRKE